MTKQTTSIEAEAKELYPMSIHDSVGDRELINIKRKCYIAGANRNPIDTTEIRKKYDYERVYYLGKEDIFDWFLPHLRNTEQITLSEWTEKELKKQFSIVGELKEEIDRLKMNVGQISEFQLCPKCNGDGNLLRYNSPNTYSEVPACDVCNGSKVLIKPVV